MRTFIAVVVCGTMVFAHFVLGAVLFGWKNGGGFMPVLISGTIVYTVWALIRGHGGSEVQSDNVKVSSKDHQKTHFYKRPIKRFENWFRRQSGIQAAVIYLYVVLLAVLTFWHNPTDGYLRTYSNAIKTPDAMTALANWKSRADQMGSRSDEYRSWQMYQWMWVDRREAPENGYFYMEQNPWWWIYGYESLGYNEDSVPRFFRRAFPNLYSLGGYLSYIAVLTFASIVLKWFVGIRSISHDDVTKSIPS
jgi:hypothetical protein